MDKNLETQKIYYFPFFTVHQWATLDKGLKEMNWSSNIKVYTDEEEAKERAMAKLFDDDDCNVLCIEVTDDKCLVCAIDNTEKKVELDKSIMEKFEVIKPKKNIKLK